MNSQDIIMDVQQKASEWLEMSQDPSMFIAEILANKIIKLNEYIEFLERRLSYDISSRS